MNEFKVPSEKLTIRLKKIQREMEHTDLKGIFIIQRTDLFYFSGTSQDGFLFIPVEGEPVLFIKRFYPRAVKESNIVNIIKINSIKDIPIKF